MFIVFDSARRHKNSDYSKKALKLMRKYPKTHEPVTSEDRLGRDVPLSEMSLPFRASVQAFSKKCGFFRCLRYFLIGLAGLIRWCLRYQATFIVFDSAGRHKNSDYSKKALKLMRKYAKINESGVWQNVQIMFLVHSRSFSINSGHCSKKDTTRRVLRVERTNAGMRERGSKHVTHRFYIVHVH
jgi:hypothetical protein